MNFFRWKLSPIISSSIPFLWKIKNRLQREVFEFKKNKYNKNNTHLKPKNHSNWYFYVLIFFLKFLCVSGKKKIDKIVKEAAWNSFLNFWMEMKTNNEKKNAKQTLVSAIKMIFISIAFDIKPITCIRIQWCVNTSNDIVCVWYASKDSDWKKSKYNAVCWMCFFQFRFNTISIFEL